MRVSPSRIVLVPIRKRVQLSRIDSGLGEGEKKHTTACFLTPYSLHVSIQGENSYLQTRRKPSDTTSAGMAP